MFYDYLYHAAPRLAPKAPGRRITWLHGGHIALMEAMVRHANLIARC